MEYLIIKKRLSCLAHAYLLGTLILCPLIQAIVTLLMVAIFPIGPLATNLRAAEGNSEVLRHLENTYGDAIVYLSTRVKDHSKSNIEQPPITGTGFIINDKGYIITANHVIPWEAPDQYQKVWKTTVHTMSMVKGNPPLHAKVIKRLPKYDLALLQIEHSPHNIAKVKIGDPRSVKKYDYLYLAGFPGKKALFITDGRVQSLNSQTEKDKWEAQFDKTHGDSGGPTFHNDEVVAVLQSGYVTTQKNTILAPIILADKFLEKAGVWPPWKGRQAVINNLKSRDKAVTDALKTTTSLQMSDAMAEELYAIRERITNQDNSVRGYRHHLFKMGSALVEMKTHFNEQHLEKALEALNDGDVEPARKLLGAVAVKAEDDAGEACYQLGTIAEEIDIDYESALSWYRRALLKPTPKPIYFDAAATMAHTLGDHESALQWYKDSVRLREGKDGQEEPGFAVSLCRLAGITIESDPKRTVENCERALSILKRFPGQEIEIANMNDTLGAAYGFIADYKRAEEAYQRALNISERVGALTDEPEALKIFGNTNNNLSGLYRTMGRYRDSLPFTEAAISTNERVYGKRHPRLGIDRAGLAILNRALGNYTESQTQFATARKLLTSAMGRNNRLVGLVLSGMASLELIQRTDDEASKSAQDALDIFVQKFGRENSIFEMRARMVMAEIKSIQGKHKDAEDELKCADRINRTKYPSRVRDTMKIQLLGAAAHIRQGDFQKANDLIVKAQEVSVQRVHDDDPLWGEMFLIKGKVSVEARNFGEAEKEFEKAQRLFSSSLGRNHPKRAAALSELARAQKSMGNLKDSVSTEGQASKILSAQPGIRVITVIDL